jgi:HEPN domain-containing protein
MSPDPVIEARRWWRQAQQDLAAARSLADVGHHNLACFHAQQAAEKMLKAYLYAKGAERVIGHDIERLCRDAAALDNDFRQLIATAVALAKYYVPTRYPNGLAGGIPAEVYGPQDSDAALQTADQVGRFIADRIGQVIQP